MKIPRPFARCFPFLALAAILLTARNGAAFSAAIQADTQGNLVLHCAS